METKKDDVRRLSNKCVGLKTLLLQHAPGNQVSFDAKEVRGSGLFASPQPDFPPKCKCGKGGFSPISSCQPFPPKRRLRDIVSQNPRQLRRLFSTFSRCRLSQKVDASEAISKMAGLDGEGGRWDEFDIAAEAFQEMVEEQKESLKGVLEEEVMELNQARRYVVLVR